MYFITIFFLVSLYLISMGFGFFGYIYLILYVGAITIFFLFTIMLLDLKAEEANKTQTTLKAPLIIYICCF
jgi:NADH-ubiquinone oxidoreductase chain 6